MHEGTHIHCQELCQCTFYGRDRMAEQPKALLNPTLRTHMFLSVENNAALVIHQ